jgi:hypothetical protein
LAWWGLSLFPLRKQDKGTRTKLKAAAATPAACYFVAVHQDPRRIITTSTGSRDARHCLLRVDRQMLPLGFTI